MQNFFLVLVLLFFIGNLIGMPIRKKIHFAETTALSAKGNLEGRVTDFTTGKPLWGAVIAIHEFKLTVISNQEGYFEIKNLPLGNYLIEVSFIGYATNIETFTVTASTKLNIQLKQSVVEQEAITVTGVASATKVKYATQPINILKKSNLLQSTGANIVDIIANATTGVNAISTGPAISKPIIRGLGYNRVVVVTDGVRQEGQQWGDEHGLEIDENSVQKVEILKGPASLMYGSDALGGVINLISNIPTEKNAFKTNVLTGFNSNNGLFSSHINTSAHLNNGFNFNAYVSTKSAGDYSNKYDGKVQNSRFNERNFGGYLGINKSWGYSHLLLSNFNQHVGITEGKRDANTGEFLIFPESIDERPATASELKSRTMTTPFQTINHFKIASDNNFVLSKGHITVNTGFQRNQRKEFGDVNNINTPNLFFDLKTITYNIQYHFKHASANNTAVGISGMYQQNQNKAEEVLIPEYHFFDFGLFGITSGKINTSTNYTAGLRWDTRSLKSQAFSNKFESFDRNFSNFSGSFGISHQATKNIIIKTNIARGFRAPTLSELASNGAHEGTYRYEYGDKKLKTEQSLQFDAGLDWTNDHINVGMSLFYNNINNYIFYGKLLNAAGQDSLIIQDDQTLQAFTFRQTNAHLYGFETKLDIHPHPLDWLHIENSFSMVIGQFSQSIDGSNNLPLIPAPRLKSEIRATIPSKNNILKNSYIKFEIDHTAAQNNAFTGFNTETTTPAYTLLNVGAGLQLYKQEKNWCNIYLYFNNLTNVAYQNHLSRLKYTDTNNLTGRTGVFNMGRNMSIKIHFPLQFILKKESQKN